MDRQSGFFGGRRGYHHGRLKDALVEAARQLAAERGPSGFTLAEAAKLVGVTAAAPYRHFTDRNALMGELARRGFEQFADELAEAWDAGRPDPVAALRRMGEAYLAFARREPGLYAAMFGNVRTLDSPESGAAADRALDALRRAAQAVLAHYGATAGDSRALAFEIWSLSHGVAMLTVSGHLDPARAGCDPATILSGAAADIVAGAIRRALGAPDMAVPPAPPPAPPGPWGKRG
ncbi:MAG: TetR/AcrR family transcriptional regulator [Methylobacteriaceae bacterium]|nr:TetR/AcrR family transcriptional regulator [Methylobacteriaceae bacterium]